MGTPARAVYPTRIPSGCLDRACGARTCSRCARLPVKHRNERCGVPTLPDSQEATETFVRALYDDVAGPLFGFVLRLTGDRVRAEEVVQETLVRAWRRTAHLDPGTDKLRGWLFTVARNLVTDLWRSDAARPVTVCDEQALRTTPADDQLEKAVQRWALADALNQCTPEHRDVLIAIYFDSNSIAEAAHRLGIPPGTVTSRTRRALRAMRLVLNETEATK
jgi:RNA polymerase sigma-70 factor (ECF subfamily)